MKPKVKVGDTIYSLNVGNAAWNSDQKLTPMTVIKVGRKWVTLEGKSGFPSQFCVDTWAQKTEYTARHKLYASVQEWADENEAAKIVKELKDRVSLYYQCGLTLTQLRDIKKIITP